MIEEGRRRWRLILGGEEREGLSQEDVRLDATLEALYDSERQGGLGPSSPNVARWLGDIRQFFPASVVQVMQKDALDRLGLQQMLLEPESLRAVEPDVHLVATLLSLNRLIPAKTRETAREVVRKVTEDLERRLGSPMRQAVSGTLSRAVRNRRPKLREIDWNQTIKANLKNYLPEYKTVVPEVRIGHGRKGQALRDIILCLDQSGSMASSVVYAGVFGAVLASLRTVRTQVVAFDTSVVDLSDLLHDPVELLFATRLGGGTDIERALTYSQGLVQNPSDTIFVLISDLIEGGNEKALLRRAASIKTSGVNFVTLLALTDEGAPVHDEKMAASFVELGIPSFACTPDRFPELMAAAIARQDLQLWADKMIADG
ncbi:MAG TPA: VWA domain-containing protein [Fimbriimonadaceae bacterium]|nr:VWA domain-containing protein [Fimbriimonadaceae bacterium]